MVRSCIQKITNPILFGIFLVVSTGCHEIGEEWGISVGKDYPKIKVFTEGDELKEVKICLEEQGYSGWPTTVVAEYDEEIYGGMLEGQCMYFKGKRVAVRFGTPSSGKYAKGTFQVIEN